MTGLVLPTATYELMKQLEAAGALTTTKLDLSARPDTSVEELIALASWLGAVYEMCNWVLGDLVRQAEERHGEVVAQVAEATRRSPQTIENITSIARRIPPSRRINGVHFSVHAEVAALAADDQKRFLRIARDESLTKNEVRELVQSEIRPSKPIEQPICECCKRPL